MAYMKHHIFRGAALLDQRDTDILERYNKEAQSYEKKAVEIYQIAYSKHPEKSYKLLTRVQEQWGKRTCLEIAVEAECKEFVSLVGVQEQLSMIWRGNISLRMVSAFEKKIFSGYATSQSEIGAEGLSMKPQKTRLYKRLSCFSL